MMVLFCLLSWITVIWFGITQIEFGVYTSLCYRSFQHSLLIRDLVTSTFFILFSYFLSTSLLYEIHVSVHLFRFDPRIGLGSYLLRQWSGKVLELFGNTMVRERAENTSSYSCKPMAV